VLPPSARRIGQGEDARRGWRPASRREPRYCDLLKTNGAVMMASVARKYGDGCDRFVNNVERPAHTGWHRRCTHGAARRAGARARPPVDDRAPGAFAGDPPVQTPLRPSRPASANWWRRSRPGKDARLHLTIADVHATSRIPVSTLRWLCKHKPELLGAQKHEGVWYINRANFERYMATSDREVPIARATAEPRKGNGGEAA